MFLGVIFYVRSSDVACTWIHQKQIVSLYFNWPKPLFYGFFVVNPWIVSADCKRNFWRKAETTKIFERITLSFSLVYIMQ